MRSRVLEGERDEINAYATIHERVRERVIRRERLNGYKEVHKQLEKLMTTHPRFFCYKYCIIIVKVIYSSKQS